jgi:hypothetical protein
MPDPFDYVADDLEEDWPELWTGTPWSGSFSSTPCRTEDLSGLRPHASRLERRPVAHAAVGIDPEYPTLSVRHRARRGQTQEIRLPTDGGPTD